METATVVALGNIIYEYSINKTKIDNDEILNNLSSFFPNEIYLVGGLLEIIFFGKKTSYDRDLIVVDEDAKIFSEKVAEFFELLLFH